MKTVKIQAHCRDAFSLKVDGGKWHDGYVPVPFADVDDSDDVELEIDMETGRILNWNAEVAKKSLLNFTQGKGEMI